MRSASGIVEGWDVTQHRIVWNPMGCAATQPSPATVVQDTTLGLVRWPGDARWVPLRPAWVVDWGPTDLWPPGSYFAIAMAPGYTDSAPGGIVIVPGPVNPICVPEPGIFAMLLCGIVLLRRFGRWRNPPPLV